MYRVLQKEFAMVIQVLLCGECYENVYTKRRIKYSSFKMLNDVARL
jgi:hypothetical protein